MFYGDAFMTVFCRDVLPDLRRFSMAHFDGAFRDSWLTPQSEKRATSEPCAAMVHRSSLRLEIKRVRAEIRKSASPYLV